MKRAKVESIAVVGSGYEAWYSAVFLARVLGRKVRVELVDLDGSARGRRSVALSGANLTSLRLMGIDEGTLFRRAAATFWCGHRLEGWTSEIATASILLPFFGRKDTPVATFGQPYFPQLGHGFSLVNTWQRRWMLGRREPLVALYPHLTAYLEGNRAPLPSIDDSPPPSAPGFGLHVDGASLVALLAERARELGIEVHRAESLSSRRAPEGPVTLLLGDERELRPDLIVDVSPSATVLSSGLGVGTRTIGSGPTVTAERFGTEPPPSSEDLPVTAGVRATETGWEHRIGLQGRVETVAYDGGAGTGRQVLQTPWVGNVLAAGPAVGGGADPFQTASLELGIHLAALIRWLPRSAADGASAERYAALCDQVSTQLDALVCLLVAHQSVPGSEFWSAARARAAHCEAMLAGLDRALDGEAVIGDARALQGDRNELDLFDVRVYAALGSALGLEPRGYPPVLELLDPTPAANHLRNHELWARRVPAEAPRQADFIAALDPREAATV